MRIQYPTIYTLRTAKALAVLLVLLGLYAWATTAIAQVTISGSLFENDGVTAITTPKSIAIAIGTSTPSVHSTTTDASGNFSITNIATSTIGSWSTTSAADNNDSWRGLEYANGLYVAVGGTSGDRLMTSSDGITWATSTAAGDNDTWLSVVYGNGLFVAVGNSGDRVMTSPDGINWTARSAAGNDDEWFGLTYGNGLFVAVGKSTGTGDTVMTSPDGINWTIRTAADDNDWFTNVTYANGLFVASGISGDRVMTSSDGITWATTTAADNDDGWQAVAYGNGLYVAVGNAGDDRVMTSPDGITWTPRTAAGDDDWWQDVLFFNGMFIAVSQLGDRVMTSPDGINWTVVSAGGGSNDTWLELVVGHNRLVAVGSGGGDRVMYADAGFGDSTPITLFVDDNATTSSSTATTLTYGINNNAGTTTIADIDLYADTLILKNATGTRAINLANADFYDNSNDSDILFTATTSTTTVNADLLIDSSTTVYAPQHLVIDGDFTNNGEFRAERGEVVVSSTEFDIASLRHHTSYNLGGASANNDSLSFSPEGTKFFTTGRTGSQEVYRYDLSVPWDISTLSYVHATTAGTGYASFHPDGTYFYRVNSTDIREYYMSTPWDLTTAAYTGNSTSSPGGFVYDGQMAADGSYFYFSFSNSVIPYLLTTPYDLTTAVQQSTTFLSAGRAFHMGADGETMLFFDGDTSDTLRYFKLTTPWVVSTAVSQEQYYLDNGIGGAESIELAANGRYFYAGDRTTGYIHQFTLDTPQTFTGTFTGTSSLAGLTINSDLEVTIADVASTTDFTINTTDAFIASTTFDVRGDYVSNGTASSSSAAITLSGTGQTYDGTGNLYNLNVTGSYSAASANATATAITIASGGSLTAPSEMLTLTADYSNNGTFAANGGEVVSASDAFAIGNARLQASGLSVSGAEEIHMSPNGEYLFTLIRSINTIYRHDMSVPFDLTTATFAMSTGTPQELGKMGIEFKPDGTKMYVAGYGSDLVVEYDLTPAWDISSASYVQSTTTTNMAEVYSIAIKPDGTKMYLLDWALTEIEEYTLSIPWDVSTSLHVDNVSLTGDEGRLTAINFTPDGSRLYVSSGAGRLYEYLLGTPWDVSTAVDTGRSLEINGDSFDFDTTGSLLYVADGTTNSMSQYYLDTPQTFSGTLTGSSAFNNFSAGLTTFASDVSTNDLTVRADGGYLQPGAQTVSIAGTYTNNGTLVASTSEVVFNGTTQQTATGTLNGTSAFYDLTVSNTSQDGNVSQSVLFGSPVSATGTFTMLPSTSAAFMASYAPTDTPHTFNNIVWGDGSAVSETYLRSLDDGWNWYVDIDGTQTIDFVNVKDSYAVPTAGGITAQNSTNAGNNTNWFFGNEAPVWNADDWTLFDTITIDNIVIDADLTDFPVYVDLSDLSPQFWNTVTSGGGDIRVTTNANTEVSREVVSASTTLETGELHFKAPTISSTTDTTFKIWYNGSANDYERDGTYGLENVWTSGYVFVHHLEEAGNSDTNGYKDSTANNFDGTGTSTMTDSTAVGRLGGAQDFDGVGDKIAIADHVNNRIGTNDFTTTAWIKAPDANQAGVYLAKRQAGPPYNQWSQGVGFVTGSGAFQSNKRATFSFLENSLGVSEISNTDANIANDSWRMIQAVRSGTATVTAYVDGSLESLTFETNTGDQPYDINNTVPWNIGDMNLSPAFDFTFDGQIDEVRVAFTTRSAAWIAAEYTNQSTTTNFYNTNQNEAWNPTEWTLYDTITIDNTVIDADLTDFPVYVDLSDLSPQFWNTVTSGGGDIRVTTNANTEVPREVVSASTTLQTGELHFKAPSISSTTDTTFKIWYNGSANDYTTDATYGAEGVWSNGYVVVQHMNEDPAVAGAGDYLDSTSYDHDGTETGTFGAADLVTGRVGNAIDFDADGDYLTLATTSNVEGFSAYTLSAWTHPTAGGANEWGRIISKWDGGTADDYHLSFTVNEDYNCRANIGGLKNTETTGAQPTNVWHYTTCTYDDADSDYVEVNADLGSTANSAVANGSLTDSNLPLTIGDMYTSPDLRNFTGYIDEVRIANVKRADAWLQAEYTNQSTTTNFYNTNQNEAWNPTEWTLYDTITIDNTVIDADLTDFPVYVDLSDLSPQFWNTVTSGGGDIRVTTNANVEVPREVVSASTTLQTGELHFKAPSISSTTDTTFKIWYNGSANDYERDASYGTENVWTSDYIFVLHLNEDGNSDAGGYLDSTANQYHGTGTSMTAASDVTSKLGSGQDFDGAADVIGIPDAVNNNLGTNNFTTSVWMNAPDANQTGTFLGKRQTTTPFVQLNLAVGTPNSGSLDSSKKVGWFLIEDGLSLIDSGYTTADVANGQWRMVQTSREGTGLLKSFIDGIEVSSVSERAFGSRPLDLSNSAPWTIGSANGGTYFDGQVDEVRIASTTRSAAWIAAEYTNQSTTTDFYNTNNGASRAVVTIDDHTLGQVDNAFDFQNKTNEPLYAFSLGADSAVTIDEVVLDLTGLKSVTLTDFTNARLFKDHDNDAAYDATDEQVGGTGVMAQQNTQKGTLTFSTDFTATSTTNYVVVADWTAPAQGSFLKLDLKGKNITATDASGVPTIQGTVRSVQHNRNNRGGGGGGGGNGQIGGQGVQGNATTTGGTNNGGELIGSDPDFKWPTANTGTWTNPTNAYDQVDGTYATDSAGNTNQFTNHAFVVAGGNTVQGIAVKLEVSGTTAVGDIGVELSWDGGTTWTTSKTTPTLTATDAVVTLGGPADLWGRTWSPAEFSNANFALRVTGNPSGNTVQIDAIQVKVYHQASGGGSGGGGAI